ncbi:hypothetical protein BCV72DRAFT_308876 [Rhizopus microsporus var. microsporus]|uniref:Uncharacterized protein n=1 Tax=Rhizopus microsporus var. microsporus TaxID=86635 RepID=A0A1X0QSI4_RHIZD|nr:hypothetical protein BCV72DRAFT_308876 [Rhizopus microsporus var. microsporus]
MQTRPSSQTRIHSLPVELVATYTRNLGDIQRRLRQLNHDLRLAQELQDELLDLQQMFNDINDAQDGLQDLPWQNESTLLMDQLMQLQQNFEQLNTVVNEIMTTTHHQEIANQDIENIQILHNRLIEINGNIEPIITLVRRTVANILLRIRQWKLDLQNQLPERLERLNPLERQIIQNLRVIANLRELHQIILQTLPTVQNVLRQNDLTEEARLEQIQILTVTRERITAAENQLRIVQPIEQQSQSTLNTNEAARECMNMDILIRRINSMENQRARLFQQSEHFSPHILNNFNNFEASRRESGLDTYRYAIPTLDLLHRNLSSAYGSAIVQTKKKGCQRIINHTLFDEIVFEEDESEFRGVIYNTINDYGYATNHPLKFIRLSYRLLQAASSLPDAPIKLWSLLPQTTHSMVHVPLSGIPTLYTLFQRAHQNGHTVSRFMIPTGNFFRLTDFDPFYFGYENKTSCRKMKIQEEL